MDPSKLEEVRILHRQMLEYLFNMFDEDDVRSIFPLRLLLLRVLVPAHCFEDGGKVFEKDKISILSGGVVILVFSSSQGFRVSRSLLCGFS